MIVNCLKLFFIYLIIDNVCVQSQVCTSRRVVTKRVMENKLHWYKESYDGHCYRGCVRTRWASKMDQVSVTKREIQTIKLCCDGYMHDETDGAVNQTTPQCKPICMPACKNGFCSTPGVCSCNPGYTVDPNDSHNCLPQCNIECNGTCIAPDICQCNFGYTNMNGTCHPVCTEPCENGTCVAPENCECLTGYRKSDRNLCEPYCSSGCLHGTCTSPEKCTCSSGFKMQVVDGESNESCQPDCQFECHNGTCIAPNTCECDPGYQKSGTTCEPYCSSGCHNGSCISPETCVCNDGWQLYNDTECKPMCDTDCGNGTCVSPNKCDCHPGYKLNDDVGATTCEPICENCEASCSEPNKCICDPPYKAQYLTADGNLCDCGENCTEEIKCTYTACVLVDQNVVKLKSNGTTETDNISHMTSEISSKVSNEGIFLCVLMALLLVSVIVILAIVAFKWKYIIIYFKGSSYVVEENKPIAEIDYTLSALKEKHEENEYYCENNNKGSLLIDI